MKKQQNKSLQLKKLTIAKIQTSEMKNVEGGEITITTTEPLRDYLISWIIQCVG